MYHTEVKSPTDAEKAEEPGLEELSRGELELTLSGPMLLRQPLSVVNLTVVEGKYRMVRRILHNCGHSVVSLHRTRYGNIELLTEESIESPAPDYPPTISKQEVLLPESGVRYLTRDERKWLQKLLRKNSKK